MGKTLAYKILENHLVEGTLAPGEEITIKIDQTLTQHHGISAAGSYGGR